MGDSVDQLKAAVGAPRRVKAKQRDHPVNVDE
jgi:hypothetical protein